MDQFLHVDPEMLNLFRFNLYLDDESVCSVLAAIIEKMKFNQTFNAAIERIEVAKNFLNNPRNINYPRIILYTEFKYLDVIKTELGVIVRQLPKVVCNPSYAYAWISNCTITQGYTIFKEYLAILGILDDLYDEKQNHAFRKSVEAVDWVC